MGKRKDRASRAYDMNSFQFYKNLYFQLENKFYNLYRSNWKWSGINYIEEKFVMDQFWELGTVAAFKLFTGDIGFAKYAAQPTYLNMYGQPEQIRLFNPYHSPAVPEKDLIVDKEVVLGWLSSSRKNLRCVVDWYIERIAAVEMVLRTNLETLKLPFIITVGDDADKAEKEKVEDIIDKILNNELAIYAEGIDARSVEVLQTNAPYLIDKLNLYKDNLLNELKTILGISNSGINKVEQVQMSEVSSGYAEISSFEQDYINNLNSFCDRIKETFGITISVQRTIENQFEAEPHDNDEKTGPKNDGLGEE